MLEYEEKVHVVLEQAFNGHVTSIPNFLPPKVTPPPQHFLYAMKRKIVLIFLAVYYSFIHHNTFSREKRKKNELIFHDREDFDFSWKEQARMQDSSLM